MPDTLIRVDLSRPPDQQEMPPHNRWHPEIPPVVSVDPGTVFRLECMDLTGGQILNDDSADDVARLDVRELHYLAGPIEVIGARPGDLLALEVLDIGPISGSEWGFSAILDGSMGIGLLPDEFNSPRKAIWDLDGIFATSRHIGGVRLIGQPHPSVVGCAPSHAVLAEWSQREASALSSMHPELRNLAAPHARGALLGRLGASPAAEKAARTWAARENGGNMDIKEFTKGSRGYFPVYVEGANLSLGDLHFSRGDGKVAGLGAIKMAGGWIDLRVELVPQGMQRFSIRDVVLETTPIASPYAPGRNLVFEGISVTKDGGEQRLLDVPTAYQRALLRAIEFLEQFGYARDQAYTLLSAIPIDGRVSCLFQHPNVCVTLSLPTGVFEADLSLIPRTASRDMGALCCPSLPAKG